jgi:flavodoxin
MRALVIYDSAYGNTETIARAICDAIAGEVRLIRASEANPADVNAMDLLIVGSPTYGGKATQPILDFLAKVPEGAIKGMKVAAFDTRLSGRFVKVFGFAAEKIAESLKEKGGDIASTSAGFFVKGKKGPLAEGELKRAVSWAKEIAN